MSGFKVPIFFGTILTLVVLVLQNRTPAYQLMLLGIRFRPLPLGLLVAGAVLSGLFIGVIIQRTDRRPRLNAKPKNAPRDVQSAPEVQTFGTIPQTSAPEESESPSPRTSGTNGWDTSASSSWTEKSDDLGNSFWSRPAKAKSRKKQTGVASVTPINPDLATPKSSKDGHDGDSDPMMVEAEYRIVTPYEREGTDEFDDEFFDDFFEDEPS